MLRRLRSLNFYWLTGLCLLVWLVFFDTNSLVSQVRMWWDLRELEQQRDYYKEQLALIRQQRHAVLGTPQLLEKYARERYLMKKPTEEVFVLVDSLGNPIEK
jgi:cell division protein DivIC